MAETREIYTPAGERTKPGIGLHISSSARIAWAIVLFFLLAWEAGVWFTRVPPYLLPAPIPDPHDSGCHTRLTMRWLPPSPWPKP